MPEAGRNAGHSRRRLHCCCLRRAGFAAGRATLHATEGRQRPRHGHRFGERADDPCGAARGIPRACFPRPCHHIHLHLRNSRLSSGHVCSRRTLPRMSATDQGEESTGTASPVALGGGPTWVVDPLDGTTNFVHGHPHCAVSVGLCVHGQPVRSFTQRRLLASVECDEPLSATANDGGGGRFWRLCGTPFGTRRSLRGEVVGPF